ncbi:hypothetical protein HPB51_023446 [Rhipicephalus microplus]|uniref:Uncharacterized protein n=1 Tax=Rhipicephalus microplus TaxID=6941 RepID=A0A9J6F8T1_RHIMP|nr:hypothetical protein HPB51_023446 [Rhipicephalus microplus]
MFNPSREDWKAALLDRFSLSAQRVLVEGARAAANASGLPCEDLKDTKIWDLDQLHEKLSTFEDTTCTNAAYRITGFGRRRRDAKPGAVRRRVRRLAQHYSTDFLRHFLTELEVNGECHLTSFSDYASCAEENGGRPIPLFLLSMHA